MFGDFDPNNPNTATAVGMIVGSSFTCEATATPETPEVPPAVCDRDSKVGDITFKYTGGGCAASDNDQPSDKVSCEDADAIDDIIAVSVTGAGGKDADKVYGVSTSPVAPDGEFTITPAVGKTKLEAQSTIVLTNSGGTETNEIHTSCSQPLAVGNQFGSLLVTDMTLIPK